MSLRARNHKMSQTTNYASADIRDTSVTAIAKNISCVVKWRPDKSAPFHTFLCIKAVIVIGKSNFGDVESAACVMVGSGFQCFHMNHKYKEVDPIGWTALGLI